MKPMLIHDKPERVVAIHQPNYAPWCGYFAKMRHCDVFIILDDAQMPGGQSYVYRTKVRTKSDPQWLSIPTRYHLGDAISQVQIADDRWKQKHLGTLRGGYGRSPFFEEVWSIIAPVYERATDNLSDFNQRLIAALAAYLGIRCGILRSSEIQAPGASDERLIALIQAVGGTRYLSGKGGQNYQVSREVPHGQHRFGRASLSPYALSPDSWGFCPWSKYAGRDVQFRKKCDQVTDA